MKKAIIVILMLLIPLTSFYPGCIEQLQLSNSYIGTLKAGDLVTEDKEGNQNINKIWILQSDNETLYLTKNKDLINIGEEFIGYSIGDQVSIKGYTHFIDSTSEQKYKCLEVQQISKITSTSDTTIVYSGGGGGSDRLYSAGTGLRLSGTTFSLNTNIFNQNLSWDGTYLNATGGSSSYSAGTGINLSGTTFSLNGSIFNENLSWDGTYLNATGGSSSYSAGSGINLSGSTFSLNGSIFNENLSWDGTYLNATGGTGINDGYHDLTKIWNTNDNNWSATEENIQKAVNDLNNNSGTVWLPSYGSIICDSELPIKLYDHIKLDGQCCILDIRTDANVIEPEPYSEICNLIIDVSYMVNDLASDYTSSCIYIDGTHEFNTFKSLYIHDIEFIGEDQGWTDYCTGNAFKLYGPAGKNCYSALIEDCWVRNFGHAILISALATSSIQQNIFSNFDIHNCIHGVVINGGGYDTCGLNLFENFNIQPYTWSLDAFHIEGEQNEIANFICADASTFVNDTAVIHLTSSARKTKVDCNLEKSAILDEQSVDNAYKGTIITNSELDIPYVNITGHSGTTFGSALSVSQINPKGNWGRWGSIARWYTWFYTFVPDGTTTFLRQYGGNTGEYMQFKVDTVTGTITTNGLNIVLDPPAGKFVGINDTTPSYELDVTGDIHCTGKLTSDGGNDPPYVLFNKETLLNITKRLNMEVPQDEDNKWDGQAIFYDSEKKGMFLINPKTKELDEFILKSEYDKLEQRVTELENLIQQLMEEK